MHLNFRPARLADLPACLPCTRDLCAFNPEKQRLLLRMWGALLHEGAVNFWVMENLVAPPGEEIAYFCLIVFLTEAFRAEMTTSLPPCIGLQALERWAAGASPFLDLAAVRRTNTEGGLVMACLQSGFQPSLVNGEAGREARDKLADIIYLTKAGYRTEVCFIEAYSAWQRDWAAMAGYHVCRDYAEFYTALPDEASPQPRACLYGVTREEAMQNEGTITAPVFHYRPPQFALRPPQQELLLWALSGMTDEEIAEELDVALITVRKRWNTIYENVLEVAPELLPAETQAAQQKRGPEKRRRLLLYLRNHMEELRPICPPERGKRGAAF